MQFHLMVASIFLKTCVKDMIMEIAPANLVARDREKPWGRGWAPADY